MRAAVAFHHDTFSQTHTRQGKTGRQIKNKRFSGDGGDNFRINVLFADWPDVPQAVGALPPPRLTNASTEQPLGQQQEGRSRKPNSSLRGKKRVREGHNKEGNKEKRYHPHKCQQLGGTTKQHTSRGHNVNRTSGRAEEARKKTPGN